MALYRSEQNEHVLVRERRPTLNVNARHVEPRISVVIPTLNEAKNLPYVFARLPTDVFEVVVVDGHSTDDTVEVARALRADVRVLQQTRRGKGNALACAFRVCRGNIIVMLDADGSSDPAEIPAFVGTLLAGADFAKGSRFAQGGGSEDVTRFRSAGNSVLNLMVNFMYGTRYTDLCYGYNAFWTHCLPYMNVDCDGFEVETLINIRLAKAGLRVVEVPSFEADRVHGVSNLDAFRDGFRVLRTILTERFNQVPTCDSERRPALVISTSFWDGVERRGYTDRRSEDDRRQAGRAGPGRRSGRGRRPTDFAGSISRQDTSLSRTPAR